MIESYEEAEAEAGRGRSKGESIYRRENGDINNRNLSNVTLCPMVKDQHQRRMILGRNKMLDEINEINRRKLINSQSKEGALNMPQTQTPRSTFSGSNVRQVNVVGQLNHFANKGVLLLVANFVLAIIFFGSGDHTIVEASVWPFSSKSNHNQNNNNNHNHQQQQQQQQHHLSASINQMNGTKVAKRAIKANSLINNHGRAQPPPPMSQQFHYFWNHDKIEPKVLASEAEKILDDAQKQTNEIALNPTSLILNDDEQINSSSLQDRDDSKKSSQKNDPIQASGSQSFPMAIPPAIDQQLTNLVLHMQKQQKMSMLMQPRFYSLAPDASRRVSSALSPLNLLNPHWMSGSSQHAVIAPPPSLQSHQLQPNHYSSQHQHQHQLTQPLFSASDPLVSFVPSSQQGDSSILSRATVAAMSGVPIHGPYVIAPSPFILQAAAAQRHLMGAPFNNQQMGNNHKSSSTGSHSTGRFGPSLLGRRKSKPFFNFGSASSGRSSAQSSSSMLQSASQVLPTLAMPPATDQSVALDAASNQLIAALASQVQQKLTEALVQLALQRDQQQIASRLAQAGSSIQNGNGSEGQRAANIQMVAPTTTLEFAPNQANSAEIQIGQKPLNMQPPYQVITSGLLGSAQAALNQLVALSQQPTRVLPQISSELANLTSIPFGQRFKRRHLNMSTPIVATQNKQSPVQILRLPSVTRTPSSDSITLTRLELADGPFVVESADNMVISNNMQQNQGKEEQKIVVNGNINDNIKDISSIGETEHQTQLRRLKRSINSSSKSSKSGSSWLPVGPKSESIVHSSSSGQFNSHKLGLKEPIEDVPKLMSYESNRTATREPKALSYFIGFPVRRQSAPVSTGWSALNGSSLLRRQADLSISSNSNNKSQLDTPTASATIMARDSGSADPINGQTTDTSSSPSIGWAQNSPRDRLKSRRTNQGSSVIMHQSNQAHKSRFNTRESMGNLRRGLVLVGTPSSIQQMSANEPLIATATATATTTPTIKPTSQKVEKVGSDASSKQQDPMSSSLSESTRIANYFQNVENEAKEQQQPLSSASRELENNSNQHQQQQQQQPLVSGLSSPSTHELQTTSQSQTVSASSSTSSSTRVDPNQISVGFPSPNHIMTSSKSNDNENQLNFQQQSGSQQNQLQQQNYHSSSLGNQKGQAPSYMGSANSGDISSAATGTQGQLIQPNGSPNTPHHTQMQTIQKYRLSSLNNNNNNIIINHHDQPNQRIRGFLNVAQNHHRSSSPSATVVSPMNFVPSGTKFIIGPKSSLVNDDRSTSADQSNSYNEELMPPTQSGPNGNGMLIMSNAGQLIGNEQQNQGDYTSSLIGGVNSQNSNQNVDLGNGNGNQQQQQQQQQQTSSATAFINQENSQQQQQQQQQQHLTNSQQLQSQAFSTLSNAGDTSQFDLQNPNFDILKTRLSLAGINSQASQLGSLYPPTSLLMANSSSIGSLTGGSNSVQSSQSSLLPDDSPDSNQFSTGTQDTLSGNGQAAALAYQNSLQTSQSSQLQQQLQASGLSNTQPAIMSSQQAALAISAFNHQQQQEQLQNRINQQFQESLRQFNQANGFNSLSSPLGNNQRVSLSGAGVNLYEPQTQQQQQLLQAQMYGLVDEDASARAEAAAGIASYPSEAKLLAIQSQHDRMSDLMNGALQMSSSEPRESNGEDGSGHEDEANGKTKANGKNGNRKNGNRKGTKFQPVSHHYHFNSFGSPFEDQDGQFGPLNPLDVAGALQNSAFYGNKQASGLSKGQRGKGSESNDDDKKEQQQQQDEEEKPKKKGFLRRFSIRNLFKRFRKDKKKEQQQQPQDNDQQQQQQDGNNNSSNSESDKSNEERRSI